MKLDKTVQKQSSKKFKNGAVKIDKFHLFFLFVLLVVKIISFLRCFRFSLKKQLNFQKN